MKRITLSLLVTVTCFSGCEKPKATNAKSIAVAKVGSKEILPADLTAEAKRRADSGQSYPDKDSLLAEMVLEEAMVQRAEALGLDRDPEVLRTWRSLLIGTLKRKELEPKLSTSEISLDEIKASYDANQSMYAVPEKARLSLIFAALPQLAPAEAAEPVRARMKEAFDLASTDAAGFKIAAAKFSDHQASRYRGGEVGWVMRGQPPVFLPAKVCEAAFNLTVGGMSSVIEEKNGLYLIKLLEHAPAGIRPLAEVDGTIRATLTKQLQNSLRKQFDEQVRTLAGVQTFPEVLKEIELPSPALPISEPPAVPRTATN